MNGTDHVRLRMNGADHVRPQCSGTVAKKCGAAVLCELYGPKACYSCSLLFLELRNELVCCLVVVKPAVYSNSHFAGNS